MKAVITEKPSVAREIALLLGASNKEEGCITGNGYIITWALGHLVTLGMPEDYGIRGFQREVLPILPDPFLLTKRKIKKNRTYGTDPLASKQLKIIEQVLNRCENIIVATDAGREGELIFRYIYDYLKCEKPFERLWISSLTDRAIRKGFEKLRPGAEFDGLYKAALGRSRADWLVGINASQALSITAGSGLYSLGRVQTPTLVMICKRFLEHEQFGVETYWQLQLEHRGDFLDFKSLSKKKWEDKKTAEEALKSVLRCGLANVLSLENKTITESAPLLFDLTGLQMEANKKLGLSAEQTLNIAQNLYEKKFITYPRTGSKYIPEDMWTEIPKLIKALEDKDSYKSILANIKYGRLNKHIVNDLKVTDHHGLLITNRIPLVLPATENAIYDMIAKRLLESVMNACLKEITNVVLEVLHFDFQLKGIKIIDPGWRSIKGTFYSQENEPPQELPELRIGDELKIKGAIVVEKKTKPPVLYTEAGLLLAMESAGNAIENKEEKKALQNIGIGTPATRAAVIEILLERNYIIRKNKSIVPTQKGLEVYHIVKEMKIADVALTAKWELALQKIEQQELDINDFQKETEQFTSAITKELLASPFKRESRPELDCPKCKRSHLVIKDLFVKCPEQNCSWIQFRNICGVHISIDEIQNLIENGKTSLIKGMKSKSGKNFNAFIVLNEKYESSFEFEK